jgi:hypothetical protein
MNVDKSLCYASCSRLFRSRVTKTAKPEEVAMQMQRVRNQMYLKGQHEAIPPSASASPLFLTQARFAYEVTMIPLQLLNFAKYM